MRSAWQHFGMTRFVVALCLMFLSATASWAKLPKRSEMALVISLPGKPNPPAHDKNAGRLFRGTWRWSDQRGRPALVEPVRALTEAALSCGQRRFQWRGLNYDHGNEMLLPDTQASQHALTCIARKVSFDFYVRRESIQVG
jgi:hypothetical protein